MRFCISIPCRHIHSRWASDYLRVFVTSGYVYIVGGFQVLAGLLVLIGFFVPLGLIILAAIIVNIWVFHIFMAPEGIGPAVVVTVLELSCSGDTGRISRLF